MALALKSNMTSRLGKEYPAKSNTALSKLLAHQQFTSWQNTNCGRRGNPAAPRFTNNISRRRRQRDGFPDTTKLLQSCGAGCLLRPRQLLSPLSLLSPRQLPSPQQQALSH